MTRVPISALLLVIACAVVWWTTDFASLLQQTGRVTPATVALVVLAITVSSLLAAWRLQRIASDTGHDVAFREAVASVSSGALGGALFFQFVGQLIARGALLSRHGVPFSTTVAITTYERAIAALMSTMLAAIGALAIFGRIWLDPEAGGLRLIKLGGARCRHRSGRTGRLRPACHSRHDAPLYAFSCPSFTARRQPDACSPARDDARLRGRRRAVVTDNASSGSRRSGCTRHVRGKRSRQLCWLGHP